jgi:hypothetical protein
MTPSFVLAIINSLFPTRNDLLALIVLWGGYSLAFVATLSWARTNRRGGPYIVVWLRRFQLRRRDVLHQKSSLESALRGCGTLVTLADRTVAGDFGHAFYSLRGLIAPAALLFPPLLGLLLIVLTLFLVSAVLRVSDAYRNITAAAAVVAYGLAGLGVVLLGRRLLRRRGRADASADPIEALRRVVDPIRLGQSHGSAVVSCDETHWQSAVREALRRANAVVVDAPQWSSNLAWEAEAAIRTLGPDKVIVLHHPTTARLGGEPPSHAPDLLPEASRVPRVAIKELPGLQSEWFEVKATAARRRALQNILFRAIAAPHSPVDDSQSRGNR